MATSARLGGFKILKDVVRISLAISKQRGYHPARVCRVLSEERINLPYITCLNDGHSWGLNILVDAVNGTKTSHLIEEAFGNNLTHPSKSAILSIFPHKKNPEITGRLFEAFDQEGVEADALANSPSAISVVLREEMLARASHALFEPFSFSAYRTPADWKVAQKGKERLYKEVVASYQEQKPKVYGLDYQDGQELLQIRLTKQNIGQFSLIFRELARLGVHLTFIATGPAKEQGSGKLAFCLAVPENQSCAEILAGIAPEMAIDVMSPMAIFSMNGPHFGDRYGIVSELLTGFEKNGIDLRGLSSTIASITGIVPSHQLESAIRAIQESFEVPSVTKKE